MSFRDKTTQRAFQGMFDRKIPAELRKRTKMRLDRIDAAIVLDDLRVPPSHRLEALKGGRKGQHSVRINDQYQICFVWRTGNAYNVELTDYH